MRILYMEDDAGLARRVQERLEASGFSVDLAANGEGGLIMHRVKGYDMMLIAQDMPVRSGIDVVWSLSAKDELPPSVMLASVGNAEVAVQALKLGVGDYMIKDERGRFIDLLPGTIHTVVNARASEVEKDRLLEAFKHTQGQLEESNIALVRLAAMDGLTGIANRRLFDEVLEREWMSGIETGAPLSLVLTDVDNFKLFNDIYGHLAGDDCLKRVAQAVGRMPERPNDLSARYGGEEFALILPNRSEQEGARIADAMRRGIEALNVPHKASTHNGCVTVSVGVVTRIPTADSSPAALIESADTCLYRAKEAGRNWVVSADLTRRQRRTRAQGPFRADAYAR
jgi:two-component system chemotaxis family response regulator WspR